MKKIIETALIKFKDNLWFTFLININSLVVSLMWLFKLLKNLYEMILKSKNMESISFPLGYNDLALLVVSIVLYLVLKSMYKAKDDIRDLMIDIDNSNNHWFEQMNKVSKNITDNINSVSYNMDLKVRYNAVILLNKDKSEIEVINELTKNGFSEEDLSFLGISEEFLRTHKDKIYPKSVMDKYNEFKIELHKHRNHDHIRTT